jgi:hypothetical protein
MKRVVFIQLTVIVMLAAVLLTVWQTENLQASGIDPLPPALKPPSVHRTSTVQLALPTPATSAEPFSTTLEEEHLPQIAIPSTGGLDPTSAVPTPMTWVAGDPAAWKNWPVLPSVAPEWRALYMEGLELGNNANAFSILGDCQSQPEVFMGIVETDPAFVQALPDSLQETVAHFSGSFNRYSPTVKDGTTEGALLWSQWNDNIEKKCNPGETPLDCELRVHKPSIVFIHVGTHYEARNRRYMITIIEKILAAKAIPVFVTKADNRELDERVNTLIADLVAEYRLPVWNFWSSVQHLPNHGLKADDPIYLNDEGVEIHRLGGLQALDAVWRALR